MGPGWIAVNFQVYEHLRREGGRQWDEDALRYCEGIAASNEGQIPYTAEQLHKTDPTSRSAARLAHILAGLVRMGLLETTDRGFRLAPRFYRYLPEKAEEDESGRSRRDESLSSMEEEIELLKQELERLQHAKRQADYRKNHLDKSLSNGQQAAPKSDAPVTPPTHARPRGFETNKDSKDSKRFETARSTPEPSIETTKGAYTADAARLTPNSATNDETASGEESETKDDLHMQKNQWRKTNEDLALYSARELGDLDSVGNHVVTWNHARALDGKRGNKAFENALFDILRELASRREASHPPQPQGKAWTRQTRKLFENSGFPLPTRAEEAERADIRAATLPLRQAAGMEPG